MALETVDFRRIVNTDAVIVGSLSGLTGKLALTSEAFDPGIIAKIGASDAPIKFTPDKAWTGSAWALTDKTFGGVTANSLAAGGLTVSGATTLAATSATVLTASTRVTTPEVRASAAGGLVLANVAGTVVATLGASTGTGAVFAGAVTTGGLNISEGDYIYLKGDATTDGSIRMYASGDDVFFQRRISTVWTNIFTIEG